MSGAFAAGLPQTQPAAQASQTAPDHWNWCDNWRGRWSDWRDWRDCCDRWDRDWCWDHHGRGGDGRFNDHRHHHWNDHRGDHGRGGYAGWDWYYWR
ncbi:hypothetical protein ACFV7Q_07575 [Streptomyces sp. NPDC059851]|uniref:hypothetical protein n=1 Tax=Streptomyces sp. NPDC059851 TaxID=3346971 RepID=UPI003660FF52